MPKNKTITRAADCSPYIGQIVTLAVAYEKNDNNIELVVSGVLEGTLDAWQNDGQDVRASTWSFQGHVGRVQIDWGDFRVADTYVDKIVAVEFSTYGN